MIVAIDGPAGSGKSTVARGVARGLGFTYLDSGALYRAVTLVALERRADLADGESLGKLAHETTIELQDREHDYVEVVVDGRPVSEEIRRPDVTEASSTVAAHPQVRASLLRKQRELIAAGNYVVEGRDIGTVVAPDAAVKVFLTADASERARRRAAELGRRGVNADPEDVRAAIAERDERDSTRAAAPLRPADDAVVIDTTASTAQQVMEEVLALVARVQASLPKS
jgi:cytidylate kinase